MYDIVYPIVLTAIYFLGAYVSTKDGAVNVGDFSNSFNSIMYYVAALVLSLFTWLGWALLKLHISLQLLLLL